MRAIMVCVDYCDLLEITLPRNAHHFDEIMVVTSPADVNTQTYLEMLSCTIPVKCFVSDLFYENGAIFNKWKALEAGLDAFGREGWICIMDADVIWPQETPVIKFEIGKLYTPMRRMRHEVTLPIPPEKEWGRYPIHRNIAEWAGYSQIFHASDPALGPAPWHEIDWKHAGGADSFFQRKWAPENKVRPQFEVLHLGEAGKNWAGRATEFVDGTKPEHSEERLNYVNNIWINRRQKRDNTFQDERC